MKKRNLLELIDTGEGYTLEFKENFNNSVSKEMCAFSNAGGGKILLGVNDRNKIIGFSVTNEIVSRIYDVARNMDPSVNVDFFMVDNVGVIVVPDGKDKPYSSGGKFYLRQGANSQVLKRDELLNFFQRCNRISFEKKVVDFNLDNDFNRDQFEYFRSKAGISSGLPVRMILKNLNLLTGDKPNNACVLMFARKVTEFFLSSDISCVMYKGNSKSNILDSKRFNSDFLTNFENSLSFILRNIRSRIEIAGTQRLEIPEIPIGAFRETLLNAMVHRDYFTEGRILINIFDDKVEIMNPGKLLFDEKDLGEISINRNPVLADCMLRVGLVEKIGSGIKRIRDLVPDVVFQTSSDWFKVVFKRELILSGDIGGVNGGVNGGVSGGIEDLLNIISENPGKRTPELAVMLNRPPKTVEKWLRKLKGDLLIEFSGSFKKGGYYIRKKTD